MSEDITRGLPQDGVERILARLDSIDVRLDSIEHRLAIVENRLSALEVRVDALEDKVDRRLQETRPIWEQVLVRLDGVESKVQTLEGGVTELREEMRAGFRRFERAMVAQFTEVSETRGDQRDLEKRMNELERKMT